MILQNCFVRSIDDTSKHQIAIRLFYRSCMDTWACIRWRQSNLSNLWWCYYVAGPSDSFDRYIMFFLNGYLLWYPYFVTYWQLQALHARTEGCIDEEETNLLCNGYGFTFELILDYFIELLQLRIRILEEWTMFDLR